MGQSVSKDRDEAEEFSLVCQSDEVSAKPGDNVVLSCQLEPAISAASMEIKWWNLNKLVCHYKYGQVKIERDYVGRVHFPLDLEIGKLSLKISDVRTSQSGKYTCEVIHGQQVKKEHICLHVKSVNFKLVVSNHTVHANQGEDVTLYVQFSPRISPASLTINWLKERVVIYEYVDEKEIRHRHYGDRVGMHIQELEKSNICLTLKNVTLSDSGNYTCQVKYEENNWDKKIKLHVRVPQLINKETIQPIAQIPLMIDDSLWKCTEMSTISKMLKKQYRRLKSLNKFEVTQQLEESLKESFLLSLQKSLQSLQKSLQSLQTLEDSLKLSEQLSLQSLQQSLQSLQFLVQSRRLSLQQLLQLSHLQADLLALVESFILSIQQSRKKSRLESRLESHLEFLQEFLLESLQQSPKQILPQPLQQSPQQILPQPRQQSPQQILPQPLQQSPQQILPQPLQQSPQQILPQPLQQSPQQILPQPLQQSPQQILPQSPKQILPQPLQQSPQQILPQSPQQCDNDDMDDDRNKITLFLFDTLTWMEIIYSIMHDADTDTPEGQEEEEETEQRGFTLHMEEESSIENTRQSREEIASEQEIPTTTLQQDEGKKKR